MEARHNKFYKQFSRIQGALTGHLVQGGTGLSVCKSRGCSTREGEPGAKGESKAGSEHGDEGHDPPERERRISQ